MINRDNEKRFEDLATFVREQIREYNLPINRNTLIEDDLGVTGDEAEELIINFGRKFNIDISNFNFGKYFYDEPGVFNLQNRRIEEFTIGHMEKALIAGKLDENVINS